MSRDIILGDVESLKDHLQHMDEDNSTKYQILKHLEEVTKEVVIGAPHHKMRVMLGPQYIISYCETNVFLGEDSFSEYYQHDSSMFDFEYILFPV